VGRLREMFERPWLRLEGFAFYLREGSEKGREGGSEWKNEGGGGIWGKFSMAAMGGKNFAKYGY